jgi:hypothetical protein
MSSTDIPTLRLVLALMGCGAAAFAKAQPEDFFAVGYPESEWEAVAEAGEAAGGVPTRLRRQFGEGGNIHCFRRRRESDGQEIEGNVARAREADSSGARERRRVMTASERAGCIASGGMCGTFNCT